MRLSKLSLTDIARRLSISASTVYLKLDQFIFEENFNKLPTVILWDELGFRKGQLAFIIQNYGT